MRRKDEGPMPWKKESEQCIKSWDLSDRWSGNCYVSGRMTLQNYCAPTTIDTHKKMAPWLFFFFGKGALNKHFFFFQSCTGVGPRLGSCKTWDPWNSLYSCSTTSSTPRSMRIYIAVDVLCLGIVTSYSYCHPYWNHWNLSIKTIAPFQSFFICLFFLSAT